MLFVKDMDIFNLLLVPTWVPLVVLILVLLYMYGSHNHSTWKRLGIPGPAPSLFTGNLIQILNSAPNGSLREWNRLYGRVYGVYEMHKPLLVVTDLDILREVMSKDFNNFHGRQFVINTTKLFPAFATQLFFLQGAQWKRIRQLMTPTFTASKLKNMSHYIDRCGRILAQCMKEKAETKRLVDVKDSFGAFTIDVITGTAFGLETNSQTEQEEPFVQNSRKFFSSISSSKTKVIFAALFPFLPYLMPLSIISNEAITFLAQSVIAMVEDRKTHSGAENNKRTDLLQLMVDAEVEVDDDTNNSQEGSEVKTKNRMTREEIVAQGILVLKAGYETTATTLQYLSYNLALHQDVQQRVYEEIMSKIGKEDPTYNNVGTLTYLDRVVQETLRMFPPLAMINRLAEKETTIKGVTIPAGCGIGIPIYDIMHDPEYFEDPETFQPERFNDENRKNLSPILLELPFGYGPRQCIGMRLALLEIKFAVVYLVRTVRLLKSANTPEKIVFKSTTLTVPAEKIQLMVAPRDV